jgi:hypothetical protein
MSSTAFRASSAKSLSSFKLSCEKLDGQNETVQTWNYMYLCGLLLHQLMFLLGLLTPNQLWVLPEAGHDSPENMPLINFAVVIFKVFLRIRQITCAIVVVNLSVTRDK